MKDTLKLRSQDLEVAATAATPIRYQNVFGEDLLVVLLEALKGNNPFVFSKLCYIMHKQASGDLEHASVKDFESWLDNFEGAEIQEQYEEIIRIYEGTAKATATAKKKQGERKG